MFTQELLQFVQRRNGQGGRDAFWLSLIHIYLTFIYDPDITPDDLLLEVAKNICECSKPHIANGVRCMIKFRCV